MGLAPVGALDGGSVLSTPENRRRPSSIPPPSLADDDTSRGLALPAAEVDAPPESTRPPPPPRPTLAERWAKWRGPVQSALSMASMAALLVGAVVGGRLGHRWVTHSPRFGAREIEVVGLERTQREEVLQSAGLTAQTNVLGLDTVRAARAIEQLPWVEHAAVSRRLPGAVRVEVQERTAAALVSAGGLYLCSPEGTLFKRVQPGDPRNLPVLTGIDRAEFERDPDEAREHVRDALALLSDVAASSLGTRVRVEEVHREATGELSLVLADPPCQVWLGRGPYRAKLARLVVILRELARHSLRPAEVHLESDRHPERATVRLPVETPSAPAAESPAPRRAARPPRPLAPVPARHGHSASAPQRAAHRSQPAAPPARPRRAR